MNNDELDKLLKSVPAPPRSDAYWNEFPKRVTAKLHWQSQKSDIPAPTRKTSFMVLWSTGLATACVLIGFFFGQHHGSHASHLGAPRLAEAKKCYEEIEAMFPHQIRAIVFDQRGAHLVLADKADVPASPPFYVKVCGPAGCQGFVTFSGQQIQVNGEPCEVLADEQGRIMLVGNNRVWTGNEKSGAIRVESKPLTTTL